MTIQEYFGDWCRVIDLKEADKVTKALAHSRQVVCPQIKNVFKAFELCPFSNLRVVIMGQDPYPQKGVATGIAFANDRETPVENLSSSLEVIRDSVIDWTVPHRRVIFEPDLEEWEKQGVLLLNTALSCELGKAGSHNLLWRPFISSFLTNLSKWSCGIVYALMGSSAQSFESCINKQFNHILKCRHPAYYARTNTVMPDIWKNINNILVDLNGYGIEWYKEY